MKNKVLAAFVAGGLLVGAGFLTSVVSLPGTAIAQEETDETESDGPIPRILGFLGSILDEMVGEGTLTAEQADAIVSAAEEKATELKEQRQEARELLRSLLEDGVLTEEEASQLPDDHFVFGERFDEAWEDGELTTEELRRLIHQRWRRPFRHGFRLGALLDDGGIDQSEYDALPDDHLLKQVDVSEYLEDGLITPDEFREILPDLREARSDDNA